VDANLFNRSKKDFTAGAAKAAPAHSHTEFIMKKSRSVENCQSTPVSPKAFTLIELLVVIAIIAILAALLMPALAKAKGQGQSAKCQSNEKQIVLSYMMYSQDNADFLPNAAIVYSGNSLPLGWFVEISPYIGNKNTNFETIVNPISAHSTVVACPSADLANGIPSTVPGYQAYGGYGHNYMYLGYDVTDPHVKLSRMTKPVSCCMNGDGLDYSAGLQWYNLGYLYPPSEKPDNSTGGPYTFTRHFKGDNYCWGDGHISLSLWTFMTNGLNHSNNWYYMPTPTASPD
jgi:prepilin-type N-terminal cleavage/methylation domain-containing protein